MATPKKRPEDLEKRGPKPRYKPDIHIVLVETMANLGLTEDEIANKLFISTRTLIRWKEKYPELCQAIERGNKNPDDIVERSFYQRAVGYYHHAVKIFKLKGEAPTIVRYLEHVPPDVGAAFRWLCNRRRDQWTDKHEINLTKPIDKSPEEMTDEELEIALIAFNSEKDARDNDDSTEPKDE